MLESSVWPGEMSMDEGMAFGHEALRTCLGEGAACHSIACVAGDGTPEGMRSIRLAVRPRLSFNTCTAE